MDDEVKDPLTQAAEAAGDALRNLSEEEFYSLAGVDRAQLRRGIRPWWGGARVSQWAVENCPYEEPDQRGLWLLAVILYSRTRHLRYLYARFLASVVAAVAAGGVTSFLIVRFITGG